MASPSGGEVEVEGYGAPEDQLGLGLRLGLGLGLGLGGGSGVSEDLVDVHELHGSVPEECLPSRVGCWSSGFRLSGFGLGLGASALRSASVRVNAGISIEVMPSSWSTSWPFSLALASLIFLVRHCISVATCIAEVPTFNQG